MIPSNLGKRKDYTEQDYENMEVVPYGYTPFGQKLPDALLTQSHYFSEICPNLPNTVFSFHVQRTRNNSNCQPTITTYNSPNLPDFCLLMASSSWSHLSSLQAPFWTPCFAQKHVCAIWCYLRTLAKVFRVLMTVFFPTGEKISGLFVLQC